MLQLILGRSGSGKTRQIYDELTSSVGRGNGKAHILLVPEQFSFESERALLERLEPPKPGRSRCSALLAWRKLFSENWAGWRAGEWTTASVPCFSVRRWNR